MNKNDDSISEIYVVDIQKLVKFSFATYILQGGLLTMNYKHRPLTRIYERYQIDETLQKKIPKFHSFVVKKFTHAVDTVSSNEWINKGTNLFGLNSKNLIYAMAETEIMLKMLSPILIPLCVCYTIKKVNEEKIE